MAAELSILVPIYNAAKWLSAFVSSLACQRLGNSELLFLDDCSTDDSLQVLEKELVKNGLSSISRIICHHENRGVSEARQTLLDAATGEYIIYADPDDGIDAGMYAGLLATARANDADFVWEDFYDGNAGRRTQRFEQDAHRFIKELLRGRLHGATWNKLIRRSFIIEAGARFLPGRVGLCEDLDFLCQVLLANPKMAYCDGCHYHYRVVSGSATHGLAEDSFRSLLAVEAHLGEILPLGEFAADLEYWRKGNRLAAFLSAKVSNRFFYEYIGGVYNLSGLPTNILLKGLYWMAAKGLRPLARLPYLLCAKKISMCD